MNVTVDTNIVFSALLNTNGIIGDLILNSNQVIKFWSCNYLLNEVDRHWIKLKSHSKLDEKELMLARTVIYKQINFIDEALIPRKSRVYAYDLVKDVDENDTVFVALTDYLNSVLWTGDKVLINGLRQKGFNRVLSTNEMVGLRAEFKKKY